MQAQIRAARAGDAPGIRDVFRAIYGEAYLHPEVYDPSALRRWITGPDVLVFVAAVPAGRVLGTAMVDLRAGPEEDAVGEFGRLAVRPEGRGRGLAKGLMTARLEAVEELLQLGYSETRAAVPASTAIGLDQGFVPAGYLPSKDRFDRRESSVLMIRHFGDALSRRRGVPRLVPEALPMARHVLRASGLSEDGIVTAPGPGGAPGDGSTAGGRGTSVAVEAGDREERLRLTGRGRASGELEWRWSPRHRQARLGRLSAPGPGARRALLVAMAGRMAERGALYAEADVRAGDPVAQRALLDRGFRVGGYVPAGGRCGVYREDLVRLVRVAPGADRGEVDLHPAARRVAALADPAGRVRTTRTVRLRARTWTTAGVPGPSRRR